MRLTLNILLFSTTWFSAIAQITPDAMVQKMARGINLGNILSAPIEGNWAPALEESYLEDVASVGFKTVRIPIDFFGYRTSGDTSIYSKNENTSSSYTGSPSDYLIDQEYLNRVEEVISWALDKNLVVILDIHGSTLKDEFLYTFSPKPQWANYYTHPTSAKRVADYEKFKAIWTGIAERFKDYSYDLLFEVVNEPFFFMTASEMDVLNLDIINIIRNTGSNNLDRNIIITGGGENSYEAPLQIGNSVVSSDDNLIATFHYYWPRDFTNSSSEEHNDFNWGTNLDKAEIDNDFGAVQTWSQNNNIPILFGEFGADNEGGYDYSTNTYGAFGGPENESRVMFYKYLADTALNLGFSFAAWDAGDKSNKTIYKVTDRSWVTDVRNALLDVDCLTAGIIKNADIECGYDNTWNLFTQNTAIANYTNANASNSRSSSNTMEVNVTANGGTFNTVILRNEDVINPNLSGETIKFETYAKSSGASQQFKLRMRAVVNGTVQLDASPSFNLSSSEFERFEFQYEVPFNTTSLQFQILCGKQTGAYYFDDFSANLQESLSVDTFKKPNELVVYPNPSKSVLYFDTNEELKEINIFDMNGRQFKVHPKGNQLDVSNFGNGLYFFKFVYKDGKILNHKIIIKH